MKFTVLLCTLLVSPYALPAQAPAEGAAAAAQRVIGEITAVDAGARKLTLKTDKGDSLAVSLSEKAAFLRVPPGEKDLKKASRITATELGVGDRVLARGAMGDDQKSMTATSVIVMTKSDLTQMRQRKAEEWQKNGLSGAVESIDEAGKRFVIKTRTREGTKPVTIETSAKTEMFRYAPDSIKFSDAKPGAFADIQVGDQVRALGEKDADGSVVKAEQVVSGTFKQVAGQVISVNAAAGEIKIKDLLAKKDLTVKVNPDTTLKKLPPMMAAMLARRLNPNAADTTPAGGRPGGAGGPGAGAPGAGGPGPGAGFGGPGGPGGPGGGPRGGGDMQQMLDRVPAMQLGDLKAGDDILISSTAGADPTRLTAISVIAGVEALLRAAPERATNFGGWSFGEIGMPQ